MANLIGKNVLIVDEVDDTRTTLEYAVRELEKDVELAQKQLGREGEKTTFSVFVLHVSIEKHRTRHYLFGSVDRRANHEWRCSIEQGQAEERKASGGYARGGSLHGSCDQW